MLAGHTAALLDQLGPCKGLGSEVGLSLSTRSWVGDAGLSQGGWEHFSNPSPSPPPTPAATRKKTLPLPSMGHVVLGLCCTLGFAILVYLLTSFRYNGLW